MIEILIFLVMVCTKEEREIYQSIKDFSISDDDVLIIKTESSDYDDKNNGILNRVVNDFPTLEKEIIYLCPSDLNEFYRRMKETDWFKSDIEQHQRKFPKEWLAFAIEYMRIILIRMSELGYDFTEIDTLDGYCFEGKEKSKSR